MVEHSPCSRKVTGSIPGHRQFSAKRRLGELIYAVSTEMLMAGTTLCLRKSPLRSSNNENRKDSFIVQDTSQLSLLLDQICLTGHDSFKVR